MQNQLRQFASFLLPGEPRFVFQTALRGRPRNAVGFDLAGLELIGRATEATGINMVRVGIVPNAGNTLAVPTNHVAPYPGLPAHVRLAFVLLLRHRVCFANFVMFHFNRRFYTYFDINFFLCHMFFVVVLSIS
jgi:hypothetical protein